MQTAMVTLNANSRCGDDMLIVVMYNSYNDNDNDHNNIRNK